MIKKLCLCVLLTQLTIISALSQSQQPIAPKTAPQTQSLSVLLKKTVGFLRVAYSKDAQTHVIEGTCFFVFYEDRRLGEQGGFTYLVTNRHMAAPEIPEGPEYHLESVNVRLNLLTSEMGKKSEEGSIPFGNQVHWYFPADDSVDLAVIPILPDQTKYDYSGFPTSLFATKDVVKASGIAEGDTVLFAGYFTGFPGLVKIQPIVRQGILAMIPDEKMQTTLRKPGNLYLADIHTLKGNSGSPIFVSVGGFRNGTLSFGGFPYRLLGVLSGYYFEDSDFNLSVASSVSGVVQGNSGISLIVPVDEVKSLLDSPALQSLRDAEVASKKPVD